MPIGGVLEPPLRYNVGSISVRVDLFYRAQSAVKAKHSIVHPLAACARISTTVMLLKPSTLSALMFTLRALTHQARHWRHFSFLLLCSGAFMVGSASAQTLEHQNVQRLLNADQITEARQLVDAQLEKNPSDAQMRFMLGVIQNRQGQNDAAFETFTRLTREYPELPEPYNNLAVLLADQGRYEEALAQLQMALRLHPAYATALTNQADIYVKLASITYAKALKANPELPSLNARIRSLDDLLTHSQP